MRFVLCVCVEWQGARGRHSRRVYSEVKRNVGWGWDAVTKFRSVEPELCDFGANVIRLAFENMAGFFLTTTLIPTSGHSIRNTVCANALSFLASRTVHTEYPLIR